MGGASIKEDVARESDKAKPGSDDYLNANAREKGFYDHSFRDPYPQGQWQQLKQLSTPEQTTSPATQESLNNLRKTFTERQESWSTPNSPELKVIEQIISTDEKFRRDFEQFIGKYSGKEASAANSDTLNSEARQQGLYDHPFRVPAALQPLDKLNTPGQPGEPAANEVSERLRETFANRQNTWSSSATMDAFKEVIKADEKFRGEFEQFIRQYPAEKPRLSGLDFSAPRLPASSSLSTGQSESSKPSAGGDSE